MSENEWEVFSISAPRISIYFTFDAEIPEL